MTDEIRRAVVAGPDRDLGDALETAGVTVARIQGLVTRDALLDAGIDDAELFVLTDVDEATSIPIARDENPGVGVVIYARETMPEFVRAQVDLALDPALLPPGLVVEELLGDGPPLDED